MVLLIRNYSTSQPSGNRCRRVRILDTDTRPFQGGGTGSNPVGGATGELSPSTFVKSLVSGEVNRQHSPPVDLALKVRVLLVVQDKLNSVKRTRAFRHLSKDLQIESAILLSSQDEEILHREELLKCREIHEVTRFSPTKYGQHFVNRQFLA